MLQRLRIIDVFYRQLVGVYSKYHNQAKYDKAV